MKYPVRKVFGRSWIGVVNTMISWTGWRLYVQLPDVQIDWSAVFAASRASFEQATAIIEAAENEAHEVQQRGCDVEHLGLMWWPENEPPSNRVVVLWRFARSGDNK